LDPGALFLARWTVGWVEPCENAEFSTTLAEFEAMTTKTVFSLTIAALITGCAESETNQRDAEFEDFDRPSSSRRLADFDMAIQVALDLDEEETGERVLEQLEPTLDDADLFNVPDQVLDMLIAMAAAEPCPVRGVTLGRYGPDVVVSLEAGDYAGDIDGAFKIVGYDLSLTPIGDGEGLYGDGRAVLQFANIEDSKSGRATMTYEQDEADYGSFDGDWAMDTGTGWGNVAGLWHKLADQSGGIGLGYWTRCE
jgi:hypothetical protein